jgi:hypothetical protein
MRLCDFRLDFVRGQHTVKEAAFDPLQMLDHAPPDFVTSQPRNNIQGPRDHGYFVSSASPFVFEDSGFVYRSGLDHNQSPRRAENKRVFRA